MTGTESGFEDRAARMVTEHVYYSWECPDCGMLLEDLGLELISSRQRARQLALTHIMEECSDE